MRECARCMERSLGLPLLQPCGMSEEAGISKKALSMYLGDIRDPRRWQGRMDPLTRHAHPGRRERRELTTKDR
jgi:hypothetical protein